MPGFAQNYAMNGHHNISSGPGAISVSQAVLPASQAGTYYGSTSSGGFPQYNSQNQMGPQLMDNGSMVNDFSSNQTLETPAQYHSTPSQQVSPAQDLTTTMDNTPAIDTTGQGFDPAYFDPNDPSLFNFNISDLNFGNHYGALEFGMLGHISSGAVNTPELDQGNYHSNHGSLSYEGSTGYNAGFSAYGQAYPAWQSAPNPGSRQNSTNNIWGTHNHSLDAFAIGEQAPSLTDASPLSQNQDYTGYSSSDMSPETQLAQHEQQQHSAHSDLLRQSLSQAQQQSRKQPPFPGQPNADANRKRRRNNNSDVYSTVQAPYSYTQGFHALTAVLHKRFPSKKVLRIAKALSTIRPSFISLNQNLSHDDLIFMEKCFQRTLCEYEDLIAGYGTPTILCRRTGEIAGVSKEFCLVTGWRRDVLLGKEPNLNVNKGSTLSGTQTGTSSRGAVTPRLTNVEVDPGRPQPVFLAEILDEDSVVQFYEDFTEIAFGASHTSVESTPCSLLKYRTKDDANWGQLDPSSIDDKRAKQTREVKSETLIKSEAGMSALGEQDGAVISGRICWTVKRDVFDIPMLIVMNVRVPSFAYGAANAY